MRNDEFERERAQFCQFLLTNLNYYDPELFRRSERNRL